MDTTGPHRIEAADMAGTCVFHALLAVKAAGHRLAPTSMVRRYAESIAFLAFTNPAGVYFGATTEFQVAVRAAINEQLVNHRETA